MTAISLEVTLKIITIISIAFVGSMLKLLRDEIHYMRSSLMNLDKKISDHICNYGIHRTNG